MAEKKFRVDINLQGNEIKNFGIHNVDPESVVSPFEGQEVYFEGKIYYYDGEKWSENGDASDIKAVADDLSAYKTSNDAAVASKVAQSDYDTKVAELEAADTAEAEARQAVADDLSAYKTSNDAAVALKANDNSVVHLSGAESIDDIKTFTSSPIIPTVADLTDSTQKAASTAFVASKVADYTYDKATIDNKIAEKDSLPSQAGNAGKFLTTDGTDASWKDLPEYTITKDAQAETGYAHTYHLTKDGVNVGASINIPKDMVVESGTVETCTQDNVPVEGYKNGDKYIDLVLANASESHLYILVSDLIDVYTGSTYIDITNNVISLKYNDLKTQLTSDLQDTFYTETEIDGFVGNLETAIGTKVAQSDYDTKVAELEAADTALDEAKADKATTLAGYNISDAYTKTEVDNLISGRKQVVSCPAITASGSQFTWSITNNIGADAIVSIYEGSDEVIADVNVTASTITIKFNETSALSSISAGQFKAVIMG